MLFDMVFTIKLATFPIAFTQFTWKDIKNRKKLLGLNKFDCQKGNYVAQTHSPSPTSKF